MFEQATGAVMGHLVIKDKMTQEVLRDQKNAVHFGNLSSSIAEALASLDSGHIRYMAFGNGGTTIDSVGGIIYKEPDVSNSRDESASLYSEIFKKEIDQTENNNALPILGSAGFADIKITVTLDFIETGLVQDSIDRAVSTESDAVFDEIAVYTGSSGIAGSLANTDEALLVTHVIFNPIQKSANRILEIDYTIRIQLQ